MQTLQKLDKTVKSPNFLLYGALGLAGAALLYYLIKRESQKDAEIIARTKGLPMGKVRQLGALGTWIYFDEPRPQFRDAIPFDDASEWEVLIKKAGNLNGKHRVLSKWTDANGRLGAIKISAPAIEVDDNRTSTEFKGIGRMKFKHIYQD